jgi:hypothetical protein
MGRAVLTMMTIVLGLTLMMRLLRRRLLLLRRVGFVGWAEEEE